MASVVRRGKRNRALQLCVHEPVDLSRCVLDRYVRRKPDVLEHATVECVFDRLRELVGPSILQFAHERTSSLAASGVTHDSRASKCPHREHKEFRRAVGVAVRQDINLPCEVTRTGGSHCLGYWRGKVGMRWSIAIADI